MSAALALANAGLAELTVKDKLSVATSNNIAAITGTADSLKGFSDSLTTYSAQIMTAASSWQTFRAGEQGSGTGGLPGAVSTWSGDMGGAGTRSVSPTVIINTPTVVTPTGIDPLVQAALDALARNGYQSSRAAGTNGWQ